MSLLELSDDRAGSVGGTASGLRLCLRAVGLGVAVVMVLAACTGDDDSVLTRTESPSVEPEIEPIAEDEPDAEADPEQLAEDQAVSAEIDRLRARLSPPSFDASIFDGVELGEEDLTSTIPPQIAPSGDAPPVPELAPIEVDP